MKNGQITASSTWPGLYTWRARLHHAQAWCARYNNHNQWLKFDFRRPTKVIGMAIQGRSNAHQWVTRFLLHSSQDNVHWAVYRYKNNDKVRSAPSNWFHSDDWRQKIKFYTLIFFVAIILNNFGGAANHRYRIIIFTTAFVATCNQSAFVVSHIKSTLFWSIYACHQGPTSFTLC